MSQDELKFVRRRNNQSLKLPVVVELASTCKLRFSMMPEAVNSRKHRLQQDLDNLLLIFKAYGVNTRPVGEGHYLHPIELSKVLGLFRGDAKDPHFDYGTRRVISLIPMVNTKLYLNKQMLANKPAAGYRIASIEESLSEVKKSLFRSFGNTVGAVNRAKFGIELSKIPLRDRELFAEVSSFSERMFLEFKNELTSGGDDDIYDLGSEVFDRPLI